ncbi:putative 3-methyladenine DNA glycosylase [Gordonia araii NBRC 100433]|uniref:Putative 3-methyladenine DNA glycosylase n=1 Tax=Gordonia araii NBRC 100433 TaxID=1073574 RepID=G7H3G6_9ACTN|nr:DNA-3-methyladenine glycosylase [Gordonia araii]GAB10391.1 putative 3-methyladenine DNA glycosylase [Gordonia araii NBRC 100433]
MRANPTVTVRARELLGAHLVGHGVTVAITEVEAYDGVNDPASHAFTRTPRSEIMYGPPWRLYVYRIHGHHCANVVTGPTEQASAVLIRAGRVVDGFGEARSRRPNAADDDALARGPGNLTRALGITIDDLGTDLLDPAPVALHRPGDDPVDPERIRSGPRVGVRLAADEPWRFWVDGEPSVSAYRRHPKAAAPTVP